jgi:hypothetical protein
MKKSFIFLLFSFIVGCASLLEYPTGTECANIYLTNYRKVTESLSSVTSTVTLTIQNQSENKLKVDKIDVYILFDEQTVSHKILENIEISLEGKEKKDYKIRFSFSEDTFLSGLSNSRTLGRLKAMGVISYTNNPDCFFESYIRRK